MPRYEYQCDACGHIAELSRVAVADRNAAWECPQCPDGLMHRALLSAPGIAFRGADWTPKSGRGRTE